MGAVEKKKNDFESWREASSWLGGKRMDLFLRVPRVAPRSSRASSHTPSCPCCRRRFADLRPPRSRDWGSLGFRSDFAQPEQDRTLVRGSGDLSFHLFLSREL